MKQILQDLRNGATEVIEVPRPSTTPGQLLIKTTHSLISSGTERMLVDFGRAGLLDKARQQPDRVKMVLDKVRTDGLMPTIDAVRAKLDQPLPMGYSNVGIVADLGDGVAGFALGDRVASNGPHAEIVSVPMNLCARVPKGVGSEEAAFTVVGAIGLQGLRLIQPTLGEAIVVTGLGLIGQITVQLLRAHGCRVLGIDMVPDRLELARSFGAETVDLSRGENPLEVADRFSRGRGVDGVIVAASTESSDPMRQAALMCRKRGRIVLVGVAGLDLSRADFYEKELTFQVSCSYGPGRYDPAYESQGHDYPVGFVRWTEQRNFEAVLDMLADGRIDVRPLISHRFPLDQAAAAYDIVAGSEPSFGLLLEYANPDETSDEEVHETSVHLAPDVPQRTAQSPGISFIGSGNYAVRTLIPAFKATGARLVSVASRAGVSGVHAGRKYGFAESTTDSETIFASDDVDTVVVATRHDSHAALVLRALATGKHVFVEKPLCLTIDELATIEAAYARAAEGPTRPQIMVGFNRRFAPHVAQMKTLLAAVKGPKAFVMTVNAGAIPADHWTQDARVGGGRIIGEACHFIDLLRFLAGRTIVSHSRSAMDSRTGDTVTLQLEFADGSIGTVHYFANGSKAVPKERLEVFTTGRVLRLDNFRILRGYGWPGFRTSRLWRQDKGQAACTAAFIGAVRGQRDTPIPFEEILEVSRVAIELSS
jgi:predicted dehydrogenase/threonine dehydrogenase-like Zn-dependent dehydrogenase